MTTSKSVEVPCKTHPLAPHGFLRNASHDAGRYVCECEQWEEPELSALALAEDFADWQAAKGKDHPATQEAREKLSDLLRRQEELLRRVMAAIEAIPEDVEGYLPESLTETAIDIKEHLK